LTAYGTSSTSSGQLTVKNSSQPREANGLATGVTVISGSLV
jgi:hypothetical protein